MESCRAHIIYQWPRCVIVCVLAGLLQTLGWGRPVFLNFFFVGDGSRASFDVVWCCVVCCGAGAGS